jgi:2-hydroxy-6-oxonona-2,4-dienedioate hydrolase
MSFWVELMDCEVRHLQGRYRTRVVQGGSGFPLLLLHGAGGHLENFVRNIPVFAQHYRTVAMDLIWHGRSQSEGFDEEVLPTMVDQVRDAIDTLGFERVHLEGQSLGGWVAMRFALKYPERVGKLILTTATGYVPDEGSVAGFRAPKVNPNQQPSFAYLDDPSEENIRARLQRVVFDPAIISDEMVAVRRAIYSEPGINRVQRDFFRNYPNGPGPARHWVTDAVAATIKQPTLVYWGDKNMTGPEVGKRLASVMPNAAFHSAALTGHWAQYEHHEEHNRFVIDFLA